MTCSARWLRGPRGAQGAISRESLRPSVPTRAPSLPSSKSLRSTEVLGAGAGEAAFSV